MHNPNIHKKTMYTNFYIRKLGIINKVILKINYKK